MSDTPRTDEEEIDSWSGDAFAVSAAFARTLEREINTQYEEIKILRAELGKFSDRNVHALRQRAERAERERDEALERYDIVRRMNPRAFLEACNLNIQTGKPFDKIIDDLRSFIKMNPNG